MRSGRSARPSGDAELVRERRLEADQARLIERELSTRGGLVAVLPTGPARTAGGPLGGLQEVLDHLVGVHVLVSKGLLQALQPVGNSFSDCVGRVFLKEVDSRHGVGGRFR